jgi:alkanesulfonate monooxygenase SsuD/methylene tetrahydromethanopterin reductase-like flavin-dependent oxidoreductase (luciferase family)
MNSKTDLTFSFQIGAVGQSGMPDRGMYHEAIEDAKLGRSLGYSAAWMVEHHFTDYFPTPNPLLFLSHIAAACPGLDLGTSVMVLPWYQPLRFAEDVAMLQTLTSGRLHIGMGRGVAKLEYDAFNVDMSEARERFHEAVHIIRLALKGEAFSYKGDFWRIDGKVTARPVLTDRLPNFYGAIGSAGSATTMADLGLPLIAIAQFPSHVLKSIVDSWTQRANDLGLSTDVERPIVVQCYIGDTDEEAREEARSFLPSYFQKQVEHYRGDMTPWEDIAGYEQFGRTFANLKKMSQPENIDGFLDINMVGSPETVAARVSDFAELGFNHIIVTNNTPGVPKETRHRMLTRFANEVAPRFIRHPK